MKKSLKSVFWGLIILIVGTLFLGNTLNWWSVNIFFKGWWTFFIIIPSLLGFFKRGMLMTSVIGMTIGGLLFFACRNVISWGEVAQMIFPIVLMVVGISFICKPLINKSLRKKIEKSGNEEYIAIFSSTENKEISEFNGGTCTAIFGGITLDLREAEIKKDTIIDCVCVFGEADILLPEGVNVDTSGIPLFGGIENKNAKSKEKGKGPTVIINYICVFSGIEIK